MTDNLTIDIIVSIIKSNGKSCGIECYHCHRHSELGQVCRLHKNNVITNWKRYDTAIEILHEKDKTLLMELLL